MLPYIGLIRSLLWALRPPTTPPPDPPAGSLWCLGFKGFQESASGANTLEGTGRLKETSQTQTPLKHQRPQHPNPHGPHNATCKFPNSCGLPFRVAGLWAEALNLNPKPDGALDPEPKACLGRCGSQQLQSSARLSDWGACRKWGGLAGFCTHAKTKRYVCESLKSIHHACKISLNKTLNPKPWALYSRPWPAQHPKL